MNHLTVADLKRELQTRGVSDTSSKTELLKRLEQAVEEILDDLGPKTDEGNANSSRSALPVKPSTSQIPLVDKLQSLQLQQQENKLKLRHLEIETAAQRKQIEREIQEIAIEMKIEERRRAKDPVSIVGDDVANSAVSYSSCRSFAGYEQDAENALCSPTLDILRQMQLPRMSLLNFDGDIMHYGNFIRQFEAAVANKTKSEEEKLYYLHQMTTGMAKDIVETCLHLPPGKGYAEARRLLHKRYGDGNRVATALVNKILAWHQIESNDVAALDEFAIYIRGCLNALKNVPQGLSEVDSKVIRQMLGRLPREVTENWRINVYDIEERDGRKPDFEDFVCFVEKIVRIATNPWYGRHLFPEARKEENRRTKVNTMAGSSAALSHACIYCNNPHEVSECQDLRSLSEEARKSYVLKMGLCFGCLGRGHMAKSCNQRKQCALCKGRHPTALHRAPPFTGANSTSANHISNDQGPVYGGKLNVLPVQVHFEGKTVCTNAFFDTGSTHSFCCSSLLQKLNYHPDESTVLQLNTVNNRQNVKSHIVRGIKITNLSGFEEMVLPPLFTLNEIPINPTDIPRDHDSTSHLRKQGVYIRTIQGPIELLLGGNAALAMEPLQVIRSENGGPFAIRTRFGWVLGGAKLSRQVAKLNKIQVQQNWESVNGILASAETGPSVEDRLWQAKSDASCKRTDGHYEIALPLRDIEIEMPNNRAMALKRLGYLRKKFEKNTQYFSDYTSRMSEMIRNKYAEKVTEDTGSKKGHIWYLPHHGVYHPRKPSKVRIVFDCAAQYRGACLNTSLLQGPDLTNPLFNVLVKFREEKVAFMADIEAMFMNVQVPQSDRDFLRFLWWPDNDLQREPEDYRMTVHLFGATSSPSCANYALRRTAVDFGHHFPPETGKTLKANFYVDDCLKSVSTENEAVQLVADLVNLCAMGGFNLTKFVSNSRKVLLSIPKQDQSPQIKEIDLARDHLPAERALGIYWNVDEDVIGLSIDTHRFTAAPRTRRGLLSVVASIYDPLGVAAPFIMVAKILLQELTRAQIGWDETVSQTFQKIWDSWIKQLKLLSHFRLSRCIKPASLDVVKVVELHHFSDASEKGYGTVTYIRMLDRTGRIYCSLLCSKSRVAPIKSVSIPRLELSAAALAVKVNHTVLNALDLMVNRVRYWTDSTAVLKYIRNVTARFHVFVANRIAIIHDGSDPNQWRYVCSKNNPADFVSRGQGGADFVKNYTWKNGPEFLWDNEKTWPEHAIDPILETNDPEVKRVTLAAGTIKIRDSELMSPVQKLINHYSSWWNLTRAVAWLLRIKSALVRRERQFRILQVQDIADAERLVLIQEQDKYFKREKLDLTTGTVPKRSALYRLDPKLHDGLLCVGGRLRNSALPPPTKHPIILPSKGRVTELLIRKVHEDIGHGGRQQILSELRKSYWIIKGNSAVRRVIGECFHCRRLYGQAKKQKMADLPPERVNPIESPFSSTGIDLFGPFFVKRGRAQVKRYGVIFTCLGIRAVHIEVADNLSTDSFICALRRFLSRRGPIKHIRSDRGTNFVGAKRELHKALEDLVEYDKTFTDTLLKNKIQWTFNPPGASHFGGVWERMIRSVRRILVTLLHLQSLTDETLHTFMCEVEYILNNRPLTPVSADPRDQNPLSPNDILLSRNASSIPVGIFGNEDLHGRKLWRQAQYLADQFWRRWRKEYLPLLQERNTNQISQTNLSVGDVVIIMDDTVPRGQWPLGRVKSVRTSADGLVRSVSVNSGGKTMERSANKVILIVPVSKTSPRS